MGLLCCVRVRPPALLVRARCEDPGMDEITVELVGGPLDGQTLTYTLQDLGEDWTQWGAHMIVPGERAHPEDPSARAVYEPTPMRPCTQWVFDGWVA